MFDIESYWKTDKKCPKCGSRSFQIVDVCKDDYIYECVDGIITSKGQGDMCDRVSRTCICRECGNKWRPRREIFGEYISEIVKRYVD